MRRFGRAKARLLVNTTPLITHTFPLEEIERAYDVFENRKENVIKVAIRP